MSVPEAKAFSPAPRSTITRSVSSLLASSQMRASSSYIANVSALRASGRLNVIQAMSPRRSCSRSGMTLLLGFDADDIASAHCGFGVRVPGVGLDLPAEDVIRVDRISQDD